MVRVEPALGPARLVTRVAEDDAAGLGAAVADVVPRVRPREQVRDRLAEPGALDVEVHQAGVPAAQVEDLDGRRDPAPLAEPAGAAGAEPPQLGPGGVADVAVGREPLVEHVVVEDDEDAVPRPADVELVAVAAQLERGAEGLERVLVGVRGRAAVADDVRPPAARGDALVPGVRLVRGFRGDGRRARFGRTQRSQTRHRQRHDGGKCLRR